MTLEAVTVDEVESTSTLPVPDGKVAIYLSAVPEDDTPSTPGCSCSG